jgi:hypothetical protein
LPELQSIRALWKGVSAAKAMLYARLEKFLSSPVTWIAVISIAAVGALAFGILGVGRGANFSAGQFDTQYFYVAGKCLWRGISPYDPSNFASCSHGFSGLHNSGYLYPPQFGAFAMLLSSLSFLWARAIVTAINLIAIIYLSFYCIRIVNRASAHGRAGVASGMICLIPAIILGNPFTAHVLWLGQTSLMVTAALAAAWVYGRRPQQAWLGGLFIGLSTIKPQIAFLPILWLLFEGRWAAIAVGALVSLLLSLPEIIAVGPIKAVTDWFAAIDHYRALDVNQVGAPHVFGVQSLLSVMGFSVPPLFAIGVGVMTGLWWFRRRLEDWAILPILMGLTMLFGYSHDYDLVVLVLLLPAFWIGLRNKSVSVVLVIFLMGLLCIPQRLVGLHPSLSPVSPADLGNSVLVQFRVVVVLALWIWLLFLSVRVFPSRNFPISL